MGDWLWLVAGTFAGLTLVLLRKLLLMKKSVRQLRAAYLRLLDEETNAHLRISSGDADIRALAQTISAHLEGYNASRRIYKQGDLELKEAICNISHDIRTPLTAIFGYLRLLQGEDCSAAARAYLAAVGERAEALKALTQELFEYTLTVSVSEELPLERLCVNGVLEQSISSYYSVLCEKGIVPQITIPQRRVEAFANENALLRVFGNVLSNAVKYSDGDLQVSLQEDATVTFSNRAGELSGVQVARLFERFYTVNHARKSTGLGLSIARLLMERMGGSISADYADSLLHIRITLPTRVSEFPDSSHKSPQTAKAEAG